MSDPKRRAPVSEDGHRARDHMLGLVWTLVRTDFKVRYHGTVGGFTWALLKPLTMFVVLMGVFSFIFHTDPNYRLNLIIGLFLWDFFAEGTKVGLTSLASKGYLLTKTRVPKWILVVSSAANPLVTLLVFAAATVAMLAAAGRLPSLTLLLFVAFYLSQLYLIVLGFSLATSALFLKYRDLNQVWEVMLQAGFFVAPIIYPLDIIPERLQYLLYGWPPTPVIQFTRAVLVHGSIPSFRGHVLLVAASAAAVTCGIVLFRRFAPRSVEHL